MSVIVDWSKSLSDNFEDVTLAYILRNIDKGFYIDVGANSPTQWSVTHLLYDQGWSGIDIEPHPMFAEHYKRSRPRDIYLQLAVSDSKGSIPFYCSYWIQDGKSTNLSWCSSFDESVLKKIGVPFRKTNVLTDTLKNICSIYVKDKDIHLLKVDVEGHEQQVLSSNDWNKYRPWVLIVEAKTEYAEQIENWGTFLLQNNYIFSYYDGFNRFYVAKEHSELLENFKQPFNLPKKEIFNARVYPLIEGN
jgi:FkbM family methyltransferase